MNRVNDSHYSVLCMFCAGARHFYPRYKEYSHVTRLGVFDKLQGREGLLLSLADSTRLQDQICQGASLERINRGVIKAMWWDGYHP